MHYPIFFIQFLRYFNIFTLFLFLSFIRYFQFYVIFSLWYAFTTGKSAKNLTKLFDDDF